MAGAGAFNTIVAYGRPTQNTTDANGIETPAFNPRIYAPRLLLPVAMETPIPSPENTRPSAETDYYVGNFQPTLHTSYKDWRGQFQGSYDLEQRNSYEGVLIGNTTGEGDAKKTETMATLRASNPVDASTGTHTHTM